MTGPAVPSNRLPDNEIRELLTRLDGLLEEVELTPGPGGQIAAEAVTALARVYGEALARAIGFVADTAALREAFLDDELLGHLLVLHGIHPEPVGARVSRVVARLAAAMTEQGAHLELAGIDDGVATVRLSAHGCGSAGLAEVVRDAVLALTPELSEVSVVSGAARKGAFIPLENLLAHTPAGGVRT
ncbi:hypothetical protein [Mycobacterium angelicum]|uniref:NIF system FeS cluster assembly NifU C-terminal domain-containing protein n=1 Tax=Mycobacterium angelicum TaxID=470074 RepID=A0A1X0A5Q8_MYCAN|nr:hypothetical protein [Mycobacterium angelicum]MCV7197130.1 NifU family protein [Mycobacterium angelicum]ORA25364.1 hypothetical protein BST12_03525 [Mycobacterium angelicum]